METSSGGRGEQGERDNRWRNYREGRQGEQLTLDDRIEGNYARRERERERLHATSGGRAAGTQVVQNLVPSGVPLMHIHEESERRTASGEARVISAPRFRQSESGPCPPPPPLGIIRAIVVVSPPRLLRCTSAWFL